PAGSARYNINDSISPWNGQSPDFFTNPARARFPLLAVTFARAQHVIEKFLLSEGSALVQAGITDPGYKAAAKPVAQCSTEMYASDMRCFFAICFSCVVVAGVLRAEPPAYLVFVSNERSGDVTVIDGATDAVLSTFPVGKRPRGIHATPDGRRVFVTLSGSPRMAPGLDENRTPADKRADGFGVIDPAARRLIDRWHVGSDPEQFAISKDGKFAFIANEDDASASIIDLDSGQLRGKIKVSEEPEGVGVNPTT